MTNEFQNKCVFCNDVFNRTDRIPRFLVTCRHKACHLCLKELLIFNTDFECPVDNVLININSKKITDFPIQECRSNQNANDKAVLSIDPSNIDIAVSFQKNGSIKNEQNEKFLKTETEISANKLELGEPLIFDDLSVLSFDDNVFKENELESSSIHPFESDKKPVLTNLFNPSKSSDSLKSPLILKNQCFKNENAIKEVLISSNLNKVCHLHDKPFEAICENAKCQTRVCLECALFGPHTVI